MSTKIRSIQPDLVAYQTFALFTPMTVKKVLTDITASAITNFEAWSYLGNIFILVNIKEHTGLSKREKEEAKAFVLNQNDFRLDEASLQYIDELGVFFKKYGLSRIAGSIWGVLLLAQRPMSVDGLATILGVSRTAIVTNLQSLEAVKLLSIAPRQRGDRREYYQIDDKNWELILQGTEIRARVMLEMTRTGLNIIAPDNNVAHKRLKQMEAFYQFYLEWTEDFAKAWEKRKAELDDKSKKETQK